MKQPLQDKIPPVYHPFFEPVLGLEFPEESIATCENCTRCRSPRSPFLDTKCCDYHPHLANYLAGGIFADTSWDFSVGRARIREKISGRIGVTPYGIIPPADYAVKRKALYQVEEGFHKAARQEVESLLCPYYDAGSCSIWKYRENLCVTFFCSSVGGKAGDAFWQKLNDYLMLAERELTKYALLKLGWPPEAILMDSMWSKSLRAEKDFGETDEDKYAKLWRHWAGKEEAFYTACFEVVQGLSQQEFRRITGQDREILEAALANTQKTFMESVVPDYLLLHPDIQIVQQDGEKALLKLGATEVEVSALLIPLLKAFNGRRHTKEIFDLSFQILLSPNGIIQRLREKQMLIPVQP